ncbi:MAG: hypothetical protein QOF02_3855 [Blastocatellia bacterium]|jgi:hypothetical protein|nr:hypothetical protein [Blastocatellia bacterium]
MKSNRIVAYLIGCVALALPFLVYMEYIYLLGFPDGFITELESAEQSLAYIFIGISAASASCFVYLGAVASRKSIGRKLSVAVALYILFIVIIYSIDYYYCLHLMNGVGG